MYISWKGCMNVCIQAMGLRQCKPFADFFLFMYNYVVGGWGQYHITSVHVMQYP